MTIKEAQKQIETLRIQNDELYETVEYLRKRLAEKYDPRYQIIRNGNIVCEIEKIQNSLGFIRIFITN